MLLKLLANSLLGCTLMMSSLASAEDALRQAFLESADYSCATNSFRSSEWYVVTVEWPSHDGKGRNVLWADPDLCYSDGNSWNLSVLSGKSFVCSSRARGMTNLFCRANQLYLLENPASKLVGLDVTIEVADPAGGVFAQYRQDVSIDVVDGKLSVQPLGHDICDLISAPEFRSLTRVEPVRYTGFDMARQGGRRVPRSIRPGMADKLIASVRRDCLRCGARDFRSDRTSGHAFFLSAGNDGTFACYVATQHDTICEDRFLWHLWLRSGDRMESVNDTVNLKPQECGALCLQPTVEAGTNSFFSVLRFSSPSSFLILDGKGSPTKVRDAITNVLTHRIEKLPCVEIGED